MCLFACVGWLHILCPVWTLSTFRCLLPSLRKCTLSLYGPVRIAFADSTGIHLWPCFLLLIVWKSVKNSTDRNQSIKVPTADSTGIHLWSCLMLRVCHPCLFITSDLDVQSRCTDHHTSFSIWAVKLLLKIRMRASKIVILNTKRWC